MHTQTETVLPEDSHFINNVAVSDSWTQHFTWTPPVPTHTAYVEKRRGGKLAIVMSK